MFIKALENNAVYFVNRNHIRIILYIFSMKIPNLLIQMMNSLITVKNKSGLPFALAIPKDSEGKNELDHSLED